ncbi:MAG: hypothetical protein EP329_16080 [Deltaproteobacteria bacterium]|nr:MAG: hypothetical protein EP329_16080 [Deltaproteobacteria bacterium]
MLLDALMKATLGRRPKAQVPPPNAPRYTSERGGHVESWFLRANHPTEPRALWLKATLLAPLPGRGGDGGPPTADAWAIAFDGARGRTYATRATFPLELARFAADDLGTTAELGPCAFRFGSEGMAQGALDDPQDGHVAWDLRWRPTGGALAPPLLLFPFEGMLERGFPRSKLVSPAPAVAFDGALEVFGERWDLTGWYGMQGHNWGREHAPEYAWGQSLFTDADGAPHCLVEAFSARIRLGGRLSPRFSAMVVRRGAQTYRFDRTLDFWRQRAHIDDLRWTLRLGSRDGEARLEMEAAADAMVCLGYRNPDGRLAYCYNSKLARVELKVNPVNEDAFTCTSAHGGALELLTPERDPRFPRVV